MVKNFYEDLKKARIGENIVFDVLSVCLKDDYQLNNVGDKKEFYHRGDIEAIDDWGDAIYIDVKDDSCICNTSNILAEHRVWFRGEGWCDGFMQNAQYDYVAYLSQADHKIYMLDFALWQKYYKKVFKKHLFIKHGNEQTTDGYLMPLDNARELGIVIAEIIYDDNNCPVDGFSDLELIK